MAVNLDKPQRWKSDIFQSVDMYNNWFLDFAPITFRETRIQTIEDVKNTLRATSNLTNISVALLKEQPAVLPTLRMSTCPPIAVDRLIGLAGTNKNLIKKMEEGELPARMKDKDLDIELEKISNIIGHLADPDIFVWLDRVDPPTEQELYRAATIVADRLCGSVANPIIRNAQERRQLATIGQWLDNKGHKQLNTTTTKFDEMTPSTYSFRMNVPVRRDDEKSTNLPIDPVVMPLSFRPGDFPLLVEAKPAGDFINVNKRRKEEATKMNQLRNTYGDDIRFILFLCGYFDSGYLGFGSIALMI